MMTKEDLEKFTDNVKKLYESGKIRAPVHLGGGEGYAENLIEIFKNIGNNDWVFSTWRNHYHYLLSRNNPRKLLQQILDGKSMHVFDDKFFTSAIVGGIAPIATGVAYAIKHKGENSRVWCFLGDMGASCGIAIESMRYACGHSLPINFIIEDNGLSVKTKTRDAWGCGKCESWNRCNLIGGNVKKYNYNRIFPHAGTGIFILF